jgi:arsenite methyltransferase
MSAGAGQRCRVYEGPALREVDGGVLRPGGLDLTERAMAICALPPGAWVVDVGCGVGATVEHLIAHYGLIAAGVDPSALLLQVGRQKDASLPLIRSPGERLPVADRSVEAVLAECSLSVMKDPGRALDEFRRVLKPGGTLVVSDLYVRIAGGVSTLRSLPLDSCLSGAVPRPVFEGLMQTHGFEIKLWEDHSAALKRFTAQLILSGGSLESLWCGTVRPGTGPGEIRRAIAAARPGYFLSIATALP